MMLHPEQEWVASCAVGNSGLAVGGPKVSLRVSVCFPSLHILFGVRKL